MPKIVAIRSQVRPWGLRGPRMMAAMRKTTAPAARMYLASIVRQQQSSRQLKAP
jgi:hypothetical protein